MVNLFLGISSIMNNFTGLINTSKGQNSVKIKHKLGVIVTLIILVTLLSEFAINPVSGQDAELPVYIVQSGDTISSIALRFNVTTDDIIQENSITDANLVNIGTRLRIPGLEGISGVLTSEVIPLGVTLSELSRSSQIREEDLIILNKFTSPSEIIAGMKMIIPVKETTLSFNYLPQVPDNFSPLAFTIINNTSHWIVKDQNNLLETWLILPNDNLISLSDGDSLLLSKPLVQDLSIANLPLVQGETVKLLIHTNQAVDISASLDNKPISFFHEIENEYVALHGVHAMQEPGVYPLHLVISPQPGLEYRIDQLILITEGEYAQDPEIYVDDIYVDPDTIKLDEEELDAVVSVKTPTRYWEGLFSSPISDPSCVVGYYGNRRSYNNGALLYYHTGVDFSVCVAENLYAYAPAKGMIVFADETVIRGNAVVIDHGWGVFSGYWHLAEINVNTGDLLEPGDLIGMVGNTGRSAGPHLHFEMIVNGTAVNPLDWLTKVYP
jgi:murein DD-endopeptidase MepM/ murein hydrolase activator NlpD